MICVAYGMFWSFLMIQFQDKVEAQLSKHKNVVHLQYSKVNWKIDPTSLTLEFMQPKMKTGSFQFDSEGAFVVGSSLVNKSAIAGVRGATKISPMMVKNGIVMELFILKREKFSIS